MNEEMPRTRIENFAHLSTGHLTDEVRAALDLTDHEKDRGLAPEWQNELSYFTREYGWFVYIPILDDDSDRENYARIPECLRDCFDLARNDGATWILFDRDESPIGDLRWYADEGAG